MPNPVIPGRVEKAVAGTVASVLTKGRQSKTDYAELAGVLDSVCQGAKCEMTLLSNASAVLYDALDRLNWCGFYLLRDGLLLLGPFQGKVACMEIAPGRGVCGTAFERNETVTVDDVHLFPGHIACDSASQSEIVIPLRKKGIPYGVLDIDSPYMSRFSAEDRDGLEQCAQIIEKYL